MLLRRAQYKQECLLSPERWRHGERQGRGNAPRNNPRIRRSRCDRDSYDLGSNIQSEIRTQDAVAASQNASVKANKKRGPGISGRLSARHVLVYFFTARVDSFKNRQRIGDLCNLVTVIAAGFKPNLAIVKTVLIWCRRLLPSEL